MKPADQLNLIPPGGMFTALAPLAKKGQIMLMLSSETDKLRVNLTVKADKAADALSLALLGTPAELDAELPTALAKARGDVPVLASVADQVAEQIDSKPAAEKKSTPAKPRAAAKFTKEQCIVEYVRLKAIHGDKLTMDVYSKNAKCEGAEIGRSFERMFHGWKKFAKAGEKRIADLHFADTGGNLSKAKPAAAAPAAAPPAATAFSTSGAALVSREVYDTEGKLLGTTSQQPTVNEMMMLLGTTPVLPPLKVLAVAAKRITVEAVAETAGA